MDGLKKIFQKNLTGKKVLLLFVLTNLLYSLMLLVTIPKTISFSNGMKLLDMMPLGYDSIYITTLFDALGEKGRAVYLYEQLPIDMIYPFFFGLSYCLLIAYFLKKLNKLNAPYSYLCLLPIIAGTADYGENLGIITMLNNYPDLSQTAMSGTSILSVIKSTATTVFFVSLIITITIVGVKWLYRNKYSDSRN